MTPPERRAARRFPARPGPEDRGAERRPVALCALPIAFILSVPGPEVHHPTGMKPGATAKMNAAQPRWPEPRDRGRGRCLPGWAAARRAARPRRVDSSWARLIMKYGDRAEADWYRPAIELAPAAGRGERWWPVALAIIVVAYLHVILPAGTGSSPAWVVPAVLLALLAVLIAGDPGRIDRQKTWLRIVTGIVIVFITLANLFAAVRLVVDILTNNKLYRNNPGGLLAVGGVIWVTNVVAFGLWYWDLDRGGAAARAHRPDRNPAFVFPEMQHTEYVASRLGAAVRRLPVAGLLDRHGVQPHRHLSDQAVGQAAHDARSGRVARPGRARDRPCDQHSSRCSGLWPTAAIRVPAASRAQAARRPPHRGRRRASRAAGGELMGQPGEQLQQPRVLLGIPVGGQAGDGVVPGPEQLVEGMLARLGERHRPGRVVGQPPHVLRARSARRVRGAQGRRRSGTGARARSWRPHPGCSPTRSSSQAARGVVWTSAAEARWA